MKKTQLRFLGLLVIALMLSFSKSQGQTTPFVTTWATTTLGESITIPTTGSGYNYSVNWGDGSVITNHTGLAVHSYLIPGPHTITIQGDFPRIYFNNTGDRLKIKSIEQWGDIAWTSMNGAFYGCNHLVYNATDAPDLSGVTDMFAMFGKATIFNGDLSSWDVSNVTDMSYLFFEAGAFNGNISTWDVSQVKTMSNTFRIATSFNQNIGAWNVGSVTDMNHMFYDAQVFNQDLNLWNVGSVTNMMGMFGDADAFNGNISNWNVSKVTTMFEMFLAAFSFNQNINAWNVSKVANMYGMFDNALAFDQNLGAWTLKSNVDVDNMFDTPAGQGMGCDNFGQTLQGWAANLNTPNNRTLGVENRSFSLTATNAKALLTLKGWTFIGNTSPCIALSMDLIDFQAKPNSQERSVLLTWVTAKENNNARFELLRSANGTDWNIIGSVKGNGTVDSKREYHFTDNQPETKNYYRLNQIDFDGKESASEIRFVSFTSSIATATTIYPNPTNGVITIASEAGQAYSITDLYGRVIAKGVLSTNQTSIDLTGNAKGLYVVKVGETVEKVLLK